MQKPYRPCVVAVVVNEQGLYLVGERAKNPGSWQFPQGGIDAHELPWAALQRELGEEVGCAAVELIRTGNQWIRYDFPEDVAKRIGIGQQFRGQEQQWFLVRFKKDARPDLAQSDGELSQITWRSLTEIVQGIVEFKRDAYIQGLKSLQLQGNF